ncbi:helix-turn-helix transcriptional regulator [Amycolatopsis sp. La24]|uniref:helix-turn-helix domain-containing protein n=1 Tax=Amycolatopsis sp. La24 TaxID=3028304 RepID=UPI0023B0B99C|nr:helix-turn-helix transcriptional regulator [Amycolatopsis sp. La24]
MHWDEAAAQKFGRTLRRLREERQMSQEALAFQAGVTKNQVQLIESGRASGRKDAAGPSNPRMSTLVGLAAVLNVSVSDMLESADL